MTPEKEQYKMKKWMVFMIVVAACIFAGFMAFQLKPAAGKLAKIEASAATAMVVTVRSIEPATYAAKITAFGEVVPHRQVTIKTQVEGQIVFLSAQLETGKSVKKGELLVRMEQSAFRMQVAEANNRLAVAKINLLKEEREAKDARINWQQSGMKGDPDSPLVLRGPQLAAARSEVEAATASLLHARALLKQTEIRAPFDAIIIRRNVNPGEALFAADEIATLFAVGSVEIRVHIDPADWDLLPEPVLGTKATLYDTGQSASWQAVVAGKSSHLNRESRLRTLILQVRHPLDLTPQLLPGTFVRVEISGRPVPNLLRIPKSALTQQGIVWFVDDKKKLHKSHVDPLFYQNTVVYIPIAEILKERPLLLAVSPNSSFVSGLVVQPLPEKETPDDS